MNPLEVPDWLKQYGPIGVMLWMIYVSIKTKTPDNPPAKDGDKIESLSARVAHIETKIAVIEALQEERKK